MKVVMVQHPHSYSQEVFPPLVMALGFFDGVHLGHQEVIRIAKEIADEKQFKSAVMTFDPHPSVVLGGKGNSINYITPLKDKIDLIAELGIDYLIIVRFTSLFASLEAPKFVRDYLINLHVRHVVAGFDFTYGKYGKGTMETLPLHSEGAFQITTVSKKEEYQKKISSTSIRKLLHDGKVEKASTLLGRNYTIKGTVVHGEKRGRLIGFPTANIRQNDDYLIPHTGVYAVRVLVNGEWTEGVCNVGYKPTFNDPDQTTLSIEVHLIDFDRSIYGEEVTVEWHKRIRDEQKFNGIDELKEQIFQDKEETTSFFQTKGK